MTTKITIADISAIHLRYKLPDFHLEISSPHNTGGVHTKAVNAALAKAEKFLEAKPEAGFKIGSLGRKFHITRVDS